MGGEEWTVKYNKRTGDPYYIDSKGNVSWKKPEGYKAAPKPKRGKSLIRGVKLQQETALRNKKQEKPPWVRGEGRKTFDPKANENIEASTRAPIKSWKQPSKLSGIQAQFEGGSSGNTSSTPSWARNSGSYRSSDNGSSKSPSTPSWTRNSSSSKVPKPSNSPAASWGRNSNSNQDTTSNRWSKPAEANTDTGAAKSVDDTTRNTSSTATTSNQSWNKANKKKKRSSKSFWGRKKSEERENILESDEDEPGIASNGTPIPTWRNEDDAPRKKTENSKQANGFFNFFAKGSNKGNGAGDDNYNSTVRPKPPPKPDSLVLGPKTGAAVDKSTNSLPATKSSSHQVKQDFNDSLTPKKVLAEKKSALPVTVFFSDSNTANGPPPIPKKPDHMKKKKIFGGSSNKEGNDRYDNNFQYTFVAHNIGLAVAYLYILGGGFGILWHWRSVGGYIRELPIPSNTDIIVAPLYAGPYAILLGFIVLRFESKWGLNKTAHHHYKRKSKRGIGYILSAIPALASYATLLPGIIAIICGIYNIVATLKGEVGRAKPGTYIFKGLCCWNWDADKGTRIVGFGYLFLNFIVAGYNYGYTEFLRSECVLSFGDPTNASCPSFFAPMAKFFGNMLNLNYSIILLPVLRVLLRQAAARADRNNIFPFKKAIEFHKIIGFTAFVAAFGHGFFHYLNFALKPEITILAFGNSAFITGGLLIVIMTFIYSGAHYVVRRANYEIFWYSHHTYTLFLLTLLAHGPHFWQWFLIPVVLFIIEKRRRSASRGNRKVYVESVQFIPPVLNVNFSPENIEDFEFRGGQYLYLLVPTISEMEWHPFSMSSAYGDLESSGYVSVHIRVQEPGSWTYRLKEYFRIISGNVGTHPDQPFIANNLFHYDAAGRKQKGLFNGPDGFPLLRVDGPYASPTQVYSTYRDIILVGSGIGLTPSASILRSVLRYKWKQGYFPETIRFCWILRQNEIDSFHWFIELLCDLSARVEADTEAGAIEPGHYVELNVYVTGASSSNRAQLASTTSVKTIAAEKRKRSKNGTIEAGGYDARQAVDPNDLRKLLLNPTIASKDQAETQFPGARSPNKLQNIWVWNGRPTWEAIFASSEEAILQRRAAQGAVYDEAPGSVKVESEVGVCFCGHPLIAKALKKNCVSYSAKHPEIKYTLNAEVF